MRLENPRVRPPKHVDYDHEGNELLPAGLPVTVRVKRHDTDRRCQP